MVVLMRDNQWTYLGAKVNTLALLINNKQNNFAKPCNETREGKSHGSHCSQNIFILLNVHLIKYMIILIHNNRLTIDPDKSL